MGFADAIAVNGPHLSKCVAHKIYLTWLSFDQPFKKEFRIYLMKIDAIFYLHWYDSSTPIGESQLFHTSFEFNSFEIKKRSETCWSNGLIRSFLRMPWIIIACLAFFTTNAQNNTQNCLNSIDSIHRKFEVWSMTSLVDKSSKQRYKVESNIKPISWYWIRENCWIIDERVANCSRMQREA